MLPGVVLLADVEGVEVPHAIVVQTPHGRGLTQADPFLLAELEVAEGAGEQVQVRAGESSDGGQHHVATGV